MVAAYKPRFTPIFYDGIDSYTPAAELPEFLERLDDRGGYCPRTGKLLPFKSISDDFDECIFNEMLVSLTATVEADWAHLPPSLRISLQSSRTCRTLPMRWMTFRPKALSGSMTGISMHSCNKYE